MSSENNHFHDLLLSFKKKEKKLALANASRFLLSKNEELRLLADILLNYGSKTVLLPNFKFIAFLTYAISLAFEIPAYNILRAW